MRSLPFLTDMDDTFIGHLLISRSAILVSMPPISHFNSSFAKFCETAVSADSVANAVVMMVLTVESFIGFVSLRKTIQIYKKQ